MRNLGRGFLLIVGLGLLIVGLPGCGRSGLYVGSKQFTESVILGEIVTLLAENTGAEVTHVKMLGDTSKTWNGLLTGELDIYCDYTGTILKETLSDKDIDGEEELRQYLKQHYDVIMSKPLGFNNSYGLGMLKKRAEELGITKISQLRDHPELRLGLSSPFIERADGWRALKRHYALPFATPEGQQHEVSYTALASGAVDVIDVYTTEAKIRLYDVRVLEDDEHFFPAYDAVILYRGDLEERAPNVVEALHRLEGTLSDKQITNLNYEATVEDRPETLVAQDFLNDTFHLGLQVEAETLWDRILRQTGNHLQLVGISLLLAILTAIPLGVVAGHWPGLGQVILGGVGILQTLPSFALLTFLLVLLSKLGLPALGLWCAVVALYVYSLLPIVRATHTGLVTIPLQIRESANALGLAPWPRLYLVELPMASQSILGGIKTAAVINVGFATLGGLIGAGGYGQLIFAGLIKNDNTLLMAGALPAMALALLIQGLFELAERFLVPKGLRLRASQ